MCRTRRLCAARTDSLHDRARYEHRGACRHQRAVRRYSRWTHGELFTLTNAHGIQIKLTNYGGIITSLRTPDRSGRLDDIVLGYDSLAGYLRNSPYFGAIVGRYGNRIARGLFTLDGTTYHLAVNNGPNSLHGGLRGFDKVVWTVPSVP